MADLTLNEIRSLKTHLERKLHDMLEQFRIETGLQVMAIDLRMSPRSRLGPDGTVKWELYQVTVEVQV